MKRQLIGAAAAILYASTYLVKSADSISLKTGLDRSFVIYKNSRNPLKYFEHNRTL